jgi:tRNA (guanine37-N1)-methyltransferase
MLEVKVLTLFPEMVRTVLETSILGRAQAQGQVRYEVTDIRDFAVDKHRTVDDTPYGGGAGMIMMAPCVVEAVESVRTSEGSRRSC